MSKIINTTLDDGLLTFTFTNKDGEVFSSFRMNPADVRLARRCEEVVQYFDERKNHAEERVTVADVVKYNDEIEEKINYLLGYDATESLFRAPITATTIFPNGDIFAFVVLDTIAKAVRPELAKRKKKIQEGLEKYAGDFL